jgi:pyruvate/2-oxoglutarate dehydrogenase complex dihydrolipoamide acyltransferase (E2) component
MNSAADELMARATAPVEPTPQATHQADTDADTDTPAMSSPLALQLTPLAAHAHATARAKALADERNVILDLDGDAATGVSKLSELNIVERANVAIDHMGIQASNKPAQFAFVAAHKLEHSGIRYRMADKASADWLRRPDMRIAFAEAFGGDGWLKDQTYAVIAEYADVNFNPADADRLHATATLNAIPD